ncbi:MAG: hypothetical protein B7Z53_04780 [Rhodospirillales bacterium 12-71-4]|nr:MAG: hypothetical protein B7Z53_04780 [Rhodospirillales bacterium 12-71-4]
MPPPANDSGAAAASGDRKGDRPARTARNAMIGALLLLAALVGGAQLFSGSWTAPFEMTRYIKAGPRQGARTLERDLLAAHPPGSSMGPVYAVLQRMGFACGGLAAPGLPETCRFRARRSEREVLSAQVELRHDGLVLQSIAVRMDVAPN